MPRMLEIIVSEREDSAVVDYSGLSLKEVQDINREVAYY